MRLLLCRHSPRGDMHERAQVALVQLTVPQSVEAMQHDKVRSSAARQCTAITCLQGDRAADGAAGALVRHLARAVQAPAYQRVLHRPEEGGEQAGVVALDEVKEALAARGQHDALVHLLAELLLHASSAFTRGTPWSQRACSVCVAVCLRMTASNATLQRAELARRVKAPTCARNTRARAQNRAARLHLEVDEGAAAEVVLAKERDAFLCGGDCVDDDVVEPARAVAHRRVVLLVHRAQVAQSPEHALHDSLCTAFRLLIRCGSVGVSACRESR